MGRGGTAREHLARNLRRLMAEQQITGAELSLRSGVSRAFVSRVVNGRQNLSLDTLEALAKVLSVPVHRLLDEDEPAPKGYERVNLVLPTEIAEQAKKLAKPPRSRPRRKKGSSK